jgi:hypothetical protein
VCVRGFCVHVCVQALDLLLQCFCKVVRKYKKQQLLLNYGGNEGVFKAQNGDKAVRQWCTVVFDGTDTAAIKQGMFGWEQKLEDMLAKHFSWRPESGSTAGDAGGGGVGGVPKTVGACVRSVALVACALVRWLAPSLARCSLARFCALHSRGESRGRLKAVGRCGAKPW